MENVPKNLQVDLVLEIEERKLQIEGELLEHFEEGLAHVLERGLPGHVERSLRLLVLVVQLQTGRGFDFVDGFPADMRGCFGRLWWELAVCKHRSRTIRDVDLTSSCGQQFAVSKIIN